MAINTNTFLTSLANKPKTTNASPVIPNTMGLKTVNPYNTFVENNTTLKPSQIQTVATKPVVSGPAQSIGSFGGTPDLPNKTNVMKEASGAITTSPATTGSLTPKVETSAGADWTKYIPPAKETPTVATPIKQTAPVIPTYGGLISQLVNTSYGNQPYADRAREIADAAGQKMSDIGGQGARGQAGYLTTGTSPVGEGNAAILAQTTAAQQKAVAEGAGMQLEGVSKGLTAQSQQQTGLNQAVEATAPIQVPYSNQLISPATGQGAYGAGTGAQTPALTGAVQNAYNIINSGGSYADAVKTLSAFGPIGEQALLSAIKTGGSGLNITAQNAGAQAQASTGADYQTQATDLSKNISQFSAVVPNVTSFLRSSGINKGSEAWVNETIKDYIQKNLNYADKATAESMFNELKLTSAQILGRSGQLTPTEVTSMVNSADLSLMSPQQLESYVSYIDQIGNTTLGNLQSYAGMSGVSGFAGKPAENVTPIRTTNQSAGSTVVGTAQGLLTGSAKGIVGFFQNIF